MCVSKAIRRSERRWLADIVGIRLVDFHERYLGLPCFTGRKKKHLFANIRDRVWNKIKGWNSKLFSAGGKDALIKAVLQAILTYGMNLFHLLKGLISDLHRMYARGWKLLSKPNSLVAKVLKNRYYSATSLMKVEKCSTGLVVWNSILWGRGILGAGTRWCIGNGATITINFDRWIPHPSTFQIVSPCVFGDMATMNDPMLPPEGWNIPLIRESFVQDNMEKILSLPTASTRIDDIMIWHFDRMRAYSVRNGYKVGLEMET
ncbi:hypothetical protein Dsin_010127 [Dipteronia sinensis]|uniref:Reverse transcriptase n=1 Tax=Dipteronia sinensis TaxID=43782 RepID=A0AAE0ECR5_9ROSI|nr:hypothetical protein Dsin_010127 [Dipteronia sinensis]